MKIQTHRPHALGRVLTLVFALFLTVSDFALAQETQTESEYYLPAGRAEAGREAFVRYQCHACHTVKSDKELPAIVKILDGPNLSLNLAGKESGKIATSILAPSHSIAQGYGKGNPEEVQKSPMPDFTDRMTVRELEDIITYLQSSET